MLSLQSPGLIPGGTTKILQTRLNPPLKKKKSLFWDSTYDITGMMKFVGENSLCKHIWSLRFRVEVSPPLSYPLTRLSGTPCWVPIAWKSPYTLFPISVLQLCPPNTGESTDCFLYRVTKVLLVSKLIIIKSH